MIRTEARRLLTLAGFAAADKLGYADRTGLRRKPRKTAGVPQCLGLLWLACASAAMGVASAQTQTSWPKGVYPTAPSYAAVARDSVCNFETMGGGTRMPTVCTQENLQAAGGPTYQEFLATESQNRAQIATLTGTPAIPPLGYGEQFVPMMTQIEFCDSNVITQYGGCLWSEQAAMNSIDSLAARGGSFVTINDGFLFWLMPQAGAARQEFADLFDPETGYMPTHYPNMKLIVKGSMSTEEIAGYCADLTATTPNPTSNPFGSPLDIMGCITTEQFNPTPGACGGLDCGSWLVWNDTQHSVIEYVADRYGPMILAWITPSEPATINANMATQCAPSPPPGGCNWGSTPTDNNAAAWGQYMTTVFSQIREYMPVATLTAFAVDRKHYFPFDWVAALYATPGLNLITLDTYETNPYGSLRDSMASDIAEMHEAQSYGLPIAITEIGLTAWVPYTLQPGGDMVSCLGSNDLQWTNLTSSGNYLDATYQSLYDYWSSQGVLFFSCYECMLQSTLLIEEPPFSGDGLPPLDSDNAPQYACWSYGAAVSGTATYNPSGIGSCSVSGGISLALHSVAWPMIQALYEE